MKKMLKRIKELNIEKKFAKKIFFLFALAAIFYMAIYGHEYYQDKKAINERVLVIKEQIAKKKVAKFDNVESKIFDLSEDDSEVKIIDLEDLSNNKNQDKIIEEDKMTNLEKEIADLKLKYEQLHNQNLKTATIISYVHLRQKIFSNSKNFYEELKNFDLLSQDDVFLREKLAHLKSHLRGRVSQEELITRFEQIADKIAANKEIIADSNFLKKVKENLFKLIIIRRIDSPNENNIDGQLVLISRSLQHYDYHKANRMLLAMDNEYKIIAAPLIMDLNFMIALQRIDNEILNYLNKQ
ncbi:MAG: hypothetical protein ISQ34_00155 [Rickettsiales bacterium]|nr:hypothetical protein [Rickettsiales bacterium]